MAESKAAGKIRDRIRELRRVPAGELRANPRNWRKHPDAQQKALRGALAEIGFADAVLARELEGGELELIDGHLRTEESEADQLVPTLVLDLSEEEADKLLATLDPLGAMADADAAALDSLLAGVDVEDQWLRQMVEDLRDESAEKPEPGGSTRESTLLDQAIQLRPAREYVVVMCADDGGAEFEQLRELLDLGPVRRGGYKAGSPFDAVGTQRVVKAKRLIERLTNADRDTEQGATDQGEVGGDPDGGDAVRSGD